MDRPFTSTGLRTRPASAVVSQATAGRGRRRRPALGLTLGLALGFALGLGFAAPAAAAWPEKPVRMIVPYAAGGPTDIAARLVASRLGERLSQNFVVDNRAGAGGNIGAQLAAESPADGYTLFVIGAAHAINKTLYPKPGYDVLRDFTMVATFSTAPMILLANPAAPFDSVDSLVKQARERPGAINYCSAGSGTAPHLAMESLKARFSIDLTHIPYKSSAPGLNDLIAGQVPLCFDSLVVWRQYATTGKLKALAVTGTARSPIAPDVPSMGELGYPELDGAVWYGLAAPANTPPAIVEQLNREIGAILAEPAVRERLDTMGAVPLVKSVAEARNFMAKEVADWAKVVKASGARID
ncbi:MAG: tripartite tricarboxylate transporter substrate binding protein [Lautropia sp.]